MNCFFYGTLMDEEVLAAVIGRPASLIRRRRAHIEGYRRVYRLGASYPILVAMSGGCVDGVLVMGLLPADVDRLVAFEGDDYELIEVSVLASPGAPLRAKTFMARPGVAGSPEEWTFADWRRRHGREYLHRIGRRNRRVPF